jgi:hypothetical protein
MSYQSDRTADVLSWRLGVYGGAALGGVGWGFIALFTIGAAGNQTQHNAVDGGRLLIAALACSAVGIIAFCLFHFGRNRILRAVGLALLVAPLSGWLIVASLGVQHLFGWA